VVQFQVHFEPKLNQSNSQRISDLKLLADDLWVLFIFYILKYFENFIKFYCRCYKKYRFEPRQHKAVVSHPSQKSWKCATLLKCARRKILYPKSSLKFLII